MALVPDSRGPRHVAAPRHGLGRSPLELSLADLKTKFPRAAVTAVDQCSGNSRGRFAPRVLGGEWGSGAMGNAEWAGARLQDILKAAGVRPGAVQARATRRRAMG